VQITTEKIDAKSYQINAKCSIAVFFTLKRLNSQNYFPNVFKFHLQVEVAMGKGKLLHYRFTCVFRARV